MAEIYRAVFTCPDHDEREVWYVSSRQAAQMMLSRHIRTVASSSIAAKYKDVDYAMTITPVFAGNEDAGYDPRN
jgi:hypothetical protein